MAGTPGGALGPTPSAADWVLVCAMASSQVLGDNARAAAICDAIGPVQRAQELPGNSVVPATVLVRVPGLWVVSTAGTTETRQWVLNVLGAQQVALPGLPGKVNNYWGSLAVGRWPAVRAALGPPEPGVRVAFVGYSLGGAVAQCFAALALAERYPGVTCYAAGSPAVGDPDFAGAVGPVTHRLINTGDPVPSLPPTYGLGQVSLFGVPVFPGPVTYTPAGGAQGLTAAGALYDAPEPVPLEPAVRQLAADLGAQHYPAEYLRRAGISFLSGGAPAPGANGYADPGLLVSLVPPPAPQRRATAMATGFTLANTTQYLRVLFSNALAPADGRAYSQKVSDIAGPGAVLAVATFGIPEVLSTGKPFGGWTVTVQPLGEKLTSLELHYDLDFDPLARKGSAAVLRDMAKTAMMVAGGELTNGTYLGGFSGNPAALAAMASWFVNQQGIPLDPKYWRLQVFSYLRGARAESLSNVREVTTADIGLAYLFLTWVAKKKGKTLAQIAAAAGTLRDMTLLDLYARAVNDGADARAAFNADVATRWPAGAPRRDDGSGSVSPWDDPVTPDLPPELTPLPVVAKPTPVAPDAPEQPPAPPPPDLAPPSPPPAAPPPPPPAPAAPGPRRLYPGGSPRADFLHAVCLFQDPTGKGWTEKVYFPAAHTLAEAAALAEAWVAARVLLLAGWRPFDPPLGPVRCSVSADDVFRDALRVNLPTYFSGPGLPTNYYNAELGLPEAGVSYPVVQAGESAGPGGAGVNYGLSDFPWTTLLTRATSSAGLYNVNHWLSGTPDVQIQIPGFGEADSPGFSPLPGWAAAWGNYAKLMTNGSYGWKALSKDPAVAPRVKVADARYVVPPGEAPALQVVTKDPHNASAGQTALLSRVYGTGPSVGGTWGVRRVLDPRILQLDADFPSFVYRKGGWLHADVPVIVPYETMTVVGLSRRARGLGFGRGRGKQSASPALR